VGFEPTTSASFLLLLPVLPPKMAGIERELGFKSHPLHFISAYSTIHIIKVSKLAREVKQRLQMPKISSKLLPVSDFI
jgi:hypothetical protein